MEAWNAYAASTRAPRSSTAANSSIRCSARRHTSRRFGSWTGTPSSTASRSRADRRVKISNTSRSVIVVTTDPRRGAGQHHLADGVGGQVHQTRGLQPRGGGEHHVVGGDGGSSPSLLSGLSLHRSPPCLLYPRT